MRTPDDYSCNHETTEILSLQRFQCYFHGLKGRGRVALTSGRLLERKRAFERVLGRWVRQVACSSKAKGLSKTIGF